MREKRWLLLVIYGVVLAHAVSAALKSNRPKFKIATTSTTTTTSSTLDEGDVEGNESEDNETSTTTAASETNGTTGHTLTGIPQIDYIWDPNLPRELNGYNLSEYPFYNSIPEDIDFKCDGLHDGFYASVPHKCQVYHHCLFGTRYDFLCANFTAFDQKTFICHFVSEVDCANSKKYWHRNDALYKATTTSTSTTSTTTTVAPVTLPTGRSASRDRDPPPRRRRPFRRRPAYDYYDDEYYDDEYSRPRGYGRDDYEYEDRKYRRDRDRGFRDRERDFHERDTVRSRDGTARDDRDRDVGGRDRFPARNNRRDPPRVRDPPEEDARVRTRDPDVGSRYPVSREVEEADANDRRTDSKVRDFESHRYPDKRYHDDYEDKEAGIPAGATSTNIEGLVKPAAPLASLYSRPRAPPKIRRPVPLSEQDKYAYKATSGQPTEEPRRRPVTEVAEDDYYEDELEEIRPMRRPLRRRPAYRDRERDFYDARDRDRDRPYRARYRDDEEDVRPRKHPERSRDRYYDRERDRGVERGRDRSLDRGKERGSERSLERDRTERPYSSRPFDRERESDRSRPPSRSKDPADTIESPRRPNSYDRTSERTTSSTSTTSTTTTTTCLPEQLMHKNKEADFKEVVTDRSERLAHQDRQSRPAQSARVPLEDYETHGDVIDKPYRSQNIDYQERDHDDRRDERPAIASEEYYDEPEDPPPLPPRTAVRIVKRPFLPSRGGNPNPRGLSPVGYKAIMFRKDEDKATEKYYLHDLPSESQKEAQEPKGKAEEKTSYETYKIQGEGHAKHRDEYDTAISRPAIRRPSDRQRDENSNQRQSDNRENLDDVTQAKWPINEYSAANSNIGKHEQSSAAIRGKDRVITTENPNVYSSSYKVEESGEQPTGPSNFRAKQRINEVTHRLQDIPESEYDVTLNEALTPALNQEPNLPSGFVLPLHRQLGRDAILQPSENNYKISRPVVQQQQQQLQVQQQKPFVPSPSFVPAGVSNHDRGRTVFYRTPETIQISGAQYRQHRGPWHDYTGY